uniref:Uncharacterized protein n=1 Tax=Rhizophora mucronata TaxID=61149 RepID=A0A2P2R0Y6_RHIMU
MRRELGLSFMCLDMISSKK